MQSFVGTTIDMRFLLQLPAYFPHPSCIVRASCIDVFLHYSAWQCDVSVYTTNLQVNGKMIHDLISTASRHQSYSCDRTGTSVQCV